MRHPFLILLFAFGTAQAAEFDCARSPPAPRYEVLQQRLIGGAGGWDYLVIDAARRNLFISRFDRVQVVDIDHGSLAATIPGMQGVHGIALVASLHRGYTSNGQSDTLTVFDLDTFKPTGTVAAVGKGPDAIVYDAPSKHLFVFNAKGRDASVVDPVSEKVVATIALGGKPEFAAVGGNGRLFVNIEDTAQLLAIDSMRNKIVATWKLEQCEEPSGLAFDGVHHRLFSTCQNGVMAVTDSATGRRVASVPIGQEPDAALFDESSGLIFSSNGKDGTLTVVHEDDADHYGVVSTVPTQKSARTMALDASTHRVYLVAADFGPPPAPTAGQPRPRRPVLENSFKILVVGQAP
jgi:YVTN family beta-propeller protein